MNRLYPGPRMLKTALAVAIAVLIAHLLTQTELSLFYAGFGALIAMETTLSKALRQGLVQLTGVFCGTLLGYTCGLLFPPPRPSGPPGWARCSCSCCCIICTWTTPPRWPA